MGLHLLHAALHDGQFQQDEQGRYRYWADVSCDNARKAGRRKNDNEQRGTHETALQLKTVPEALGSSASKTCRRHRQFFFVLQRYA
jgi:hypothetical protein